MVRITEELVRKRAEHNEREIGTLEEISLHQEDIEKIEHLQYWCKDLKILLLQNNIISKIENLKKLKKLEYINLAINNVERIENLEGCESLKKLDLTLNFIGELTSVKNLKRNLLLTDLYLTGNPCTDYKGYREYVITVLPQLDNLDCKLILKSERISALRVFESVKQSILTEQNEYLRKRAKQKADSLMQNSIDIEYKDNEPFDPEKEKEFWSQSTENTPEARIEIAKRVRKNKERAERKDEKPQKRVVKLFKEDGTPYNINQPRIDFVLTENEENNCYELDIPVYKYLDTSSLDVDVQPTYVKVSIKGKILQISLDEEVKTEESVAQRSQITGHLLIRMPKMVKPNFNFCYGSYIAFIIKQGVKFYLHFHFWRAHEVRGQINSKILPPPSFIKIKGIEDKIKNNRRRELLEIGKEINDMDYTKICENYLRKIDKPNESSDGKLLKRNSIKEKIPPEDFVDDAEVPPLE